MILGKNLYDADCELRNTVNAPTELVIMDNTLWMSFIYSFESKQEWWNRTRWSSPTARTDPLFVNSLLTD